MREGLRAGGQIVQEEARRKFVRSVISPNTRRTAEGFRTYVRAGSTVTVEQSLRKTTGLHPEWGALQMQNALLPAREETLDRVGEKIEDGVGGLLRTHGFTVT